MTVRLLACLVLALAPFPASGAQTSPRAAVPLDPISALIDAFQSHQVVALAEPHGNQQAHAFRLALLRDPRFAATVDDVVVECGNARYQPVVDRFVRGETVDGAALAAAWREVLGSPGGGCDLPIYEEFIRAVRDVNAALPGARKLRVLLGDPPVDWASMHTLLDMAKWSRNGHAAQVVRREVLQRKRRALIVYGGMHLPRHYTGPSYMRVNPFTNTRFDARTLVERLESSEARVFTVWTNTDVDLASVQPHSRSWPAPSLVRLAGTDLGGKPFSYYFAGIQGPARAMDQHFDALLYLGSPQEMTRAQIPPALCADQAYMAMRQHRMEFVGIPTTGLKLYCEAVWMK